MAKKPKEPEKETSERWLLTYADMITLLLALFVVLYAISQVDAQKFNAIASAMTEALGGKPPLVASGGAGPGTGEDGSSVDIPSGLTEDPVTEMFNELFDKLKTDINERGFGESIDITHDDTSITMRFKDTVLFQPNQAVMLPSSTVVLSNMVSIITNLQSSIGRIQVDGHTADTGNEADRGPAAFNLAYQRALAVFNVLRNGSFPMSKMSLGSYACYKPVAPNNTAEGMAKNRRVELRITKSDIDRPAGSSSAAANTSATG